MLFNSLFSSLLFIYFDLGEQREKLFVTMVTA